MRMGLLWAAVLCMLTGAAAGTAPAGGEAADFAAGLAELSEVEARPVKADWLVETIGRRAGVYRSGPNEIVLTNGLVRRTFRLSPNAATVGFDNLTTGQSLLRGVKPEARIILDGKSLDVGGLLGQSDYAFLPRQWLDRLRADPAAFAFVSLQVGRTRERFAWKRKRHAADLPWPSPGASLTLNFKGPSNSPGAGVTIAVHYEIYDGIPLMAKWITIHNGTAEPIRLDSFASEVLAVVEKESAVDQRASWGRPDLHVESDYEFHGMDPQTADRTTLWLADPQYTTQVNFELKTPCLLETRPPIGPGISIPPGGDFESFRTYELVYDSTDRERRGLSVRRMYRTIAPWVTENPIFMHVTRSDAASVRLAIDQCAEVGFEMVILSFGSGFDAENESPAYIQKIKDLVQYAHEKGIELGGYSLLASRGDGGAENQVINPTTGNPGGAIFGSSPCLGSRWGQAYFRKLYAFYRQTGLDCLEHDGSYPGDLCASTSHPGHQGLDDSQWTQWKTITSFYGWCRGQGIYLNVPDFYFLSGSSKTGMGYRESNWSLPRELQLIHARQNIYDGTWEKTPSMGWMFVPLTQYHGGGAAATVEPLAQHLDTYEAHLANLFGAGVQAAYRGPRLYDAPETRAVVKKWVDFFKAHRDILESDLIHLRRPDARGVDCFLHVNPKLHTRAMLIVYNPLDEPVARTLSIPLYYAGLTDFAKVRQQDAEPQTFKLDRKYRIELPVNVPARGVTWFAIEAP